MTRVSASRWLRAKRVHAGRWLHRIPAPEPAFPSGCVACGGTGKNSRDGECVPCKVKRRGF